MDYISFWKQKGQYGENRIARMIERKNIRKEKSSISHQCESCKKYFPRKLSKIEHPYYKEMHDSIIMVRMCNDCYKDSCGDI